MRSGMSKVRSRHDNNLQHLLHAQGSSLSTRPRAYSHEGKWAIGLFRLARRLLGNFISAGDVTMSRSLVPAGVKQEVIRNSPSGAPAKYCDAASKEPNGPAASQISPA